MIALESSFFFWCASIHNIITVSLYKIYLKCSSETFEFQRPRYDRKTFIILFYRTNTWEVVVRIAASLHRSFPWTCVWQDIYFHYSCVFPQQICARMWDFLSSDWTRVNGGAVSNKKELTRHSRVGRALRMCVYVRCEVNWELSVFFLRGVNWSSCSTELVLVCGELVVTVSLCVRLCSWSFLWRIGRGLCIRWSWWRGVQRVDVCSLCDCFFFFDEIITSCKTRTPFRLVFFIIGNF